ncbi:hypothetical protein EV121DRAFT_252694 [Schizophyllum commune]
MYTIHRRQLPITPAYAFTDYRAQGQTLPSVIVDIAKVPSGKLNLFNVYVALSRSSGRSTIRRSCYWRTRGWRPWTGRRCCGGIR